MFSAFSMDKLADDGLNSSNNSNKHVYKMHETNAFTLDVVCINASNNNNNNNNNNNEKMDDANQPTTANQKFNSSMRQDSINSDFSPLTDSFQQLNADDCRHRSSIEFRADDEYSINDNQSNASDEASDNNSTDNISFVSEDIVENIILLPNNFLSDDESTNSDDVVYAYRGADFEPVQVNADVNADDETDYLEMDFEPDPASEIEQEPNQSIEPIHIAPPSPNFNSPNLFNTISSTLNSGSNAATNVIGDLNIERTGVHKNWLAPIEVRLNGIRKETESSDLTNQIDCHENSIRDGINIHATNNNKFDVNSISKETQSNKSLATKDDSAKNPMAQQQNGQIYYDNTVSLSTKKYTGTIPKTSKSQARPTRSKTANSDLAMNGNGLTRLESQATGSAHCSLELWSNPGPSNQTHKRWKISDREKSASSSYCDNLADFKDAPNSDTANTQTKRTLYTARSMSFPNENHLEQRSNTTIHKAVVHTIICEPIVKRETENDADQLLSVTFESTYCTIDTIIKALEKINVLPNVRALQQALRDDESNVSQMNIPEYLIYASKRYCNYKAIIAAIEQSCDDVDVKFFAPPDDLLKTVHIPVRMIANRLPANGSVKNILTIKNKRFHQMNVLGKIVNVIRRFPDMRDDLIHNELITIPQYYPSGFICISKKKPSINQM